MPRDPQGIKAPSKRNTAAMMQLSEEYEGNDVRYGANFELSTTPSDQATELNVAPIGPKYEAPDHASAPSDPYPGKGKF
jgi:hypothetical protein